jgi:putative nucleotidyltransferase with HDIG domain
MLVSLAVPIEIVERADVVFTSASANTEPPPRFFSDPADLPQLNWDAINSQKWVMPSDAEKQARMAEVLVHRQVPVREISHIIAWNEHFRDQVLNIFKEAGVTAPPIKFDNRHYFTQYPKYPNKSLVTGPMFARLVLRDATKTLQAAIDKSRTTTFANLNELRLKLRDKPRSIALLDELFGLKSENPMHREDVGQHSVHVATLLRESSEFQALCDTDKLLCELAAYLHDVGKGPKSRWKDNGFRQKADPDHPLTGVELVASYLAASVQTMKERSSRVLLMLIGFHDLIGDILGRGRNREQLLGVVTDMRDMDMLIALAKADVCSLSAAWWKSADVAELRVWVEKQLATRGKTHTEEDDDD